MMPELQVERVATFRDLMWSAAGARPLLSIGSTVLAVTAIALLTLGTLGVLSTTARRRRREWAIQMALGASPERVTRELVGTIAVATVCVVGANAIALMATRGAIERLLPLPPGAMPLRQTTRFPSCRSDPRFAEDHKSGVVQVALHGSYGRALAAAYW
ncbi:MAG: hypothetical protein LC791_09365 [Acidobacteria bacterium]|nr:hypothetical protein [Acidobacteriota bacterium]